jgi:predicted CopG family antitoxin
MEKLESEDIRLSYSSANLLRNCERKYQYYKVEKIEADKDSARDNSHFGLGKAFHYVNEIGMHQKPAKIGELLEKCVVDKEIGMEEKDAGLVHAMLLQYWRLRSKQDFEAVGCEYQISDKKVIGYVDLIEKLPDGRWTISDLKTAASFYESKISELSRDRQLNLYASYYKEIAKHYKLDPEKFIGCRYLVTTKSKAVQQGRESYSDYVMRLVEKKNVKSYAVFIPKELMDLEGAKKEHLELYKRSVAIRKGAKTKQNFTYCQAYFRPCEYFSQCHGMSYSEFQESNKIVVEAIR